METKKNLYLLVMALILTSTSLSAQVKLYDDFEIEQFKMFNSIEDALVQPDSVFILFLAYKNLTEVPKEISKFRNLISLEFGDNDIKEIPSFVFTLTKLQRLGFSHNDITVIPQDISKLKNLISFKIWNNKLTNVPDALLNLPNIQVIEIKGNPIPKQEIDRILKKCPTKKILF
jgi:Leucine-rich repeat (LRR) protein